MIQEPTNYHLIGDFTSYAKIFDEGHTFVAFDTETTGLKAEEERVIEIGAVKFNKNGIIEQYNALINPKKHIPFNVTEINHITDEMVKNEPTAEKVIPEFLEFSKNCILIAHNAPFDLRFINHELIRLNMDTLQNSVIDNLKYSRWSFPSLGVWKQTFLADYLNVNIKDAHRAYDDARVCMEIFKKIVEKTKNR